LFGSGGSSSFGGATSGAGGGPFSARGAFSGGAGGVAATGFGAATQNQTSGW